MAFASYCSTPMILTWGAIRLMYTPAPAIRPPPPTQKKTAFRSCKFVCRSSSMPIVPCPAMTYGSSNGGIDIRPCSFSNLAASVFAASKSAPCNMTEPPNLETFLCLISGVPEGITMVAGIFSFRAEYATPWAWFPALHATTPLHLSFGSKCAILLYAPRSLKLNTGCRSSRLSRTLHSSRLLRFVAWVRGVSLTTS
jgi:hypothetical protein